jgi:hypothetical protein
MYNEKEWEEKDLGPFVVIFFFDTLGTRRHLWNSTPQKMIHENQN